MIRLLAPDPEIGRYLVGLVYLTGMINNQLPAINKHAHCLENKQIHYTIPTNTTILITLATALDGILANMHEPYTKNAFFMIILKWDLGHSQHNQYTDHYGNIF